MSEYYETIIRLLKCTCTIEGFILFCVFARVIDAFNSYYKSLKGNKNDKYNK